MSTKKLLSGLCPTLTILLFMQVNPAFAVQQPPPQQNTASGQSILERYDQDGDGRITLTEFPDSPERFDQLDFNGDGALTIEELPQPKIPESNKKVTVDKAGTWRSSTGKRI